MRREFPPRSALMSPGPTGVLIRHKSWRHSPNMAWGLLKKPYLRYSRSETEISYMRALKQVSFESNNVMNPGKLLIAIVAAL